VFNAVVSIAARLPVRQKARQVGQYAITNTPCGQYGAYLTVGDGRSDSVMMIDSVPTSPICASMLWNIVLAALRPGI
jgi:hypothetical protein